MVLQLVCSAAWVAFCSGRRCVAHGCCLCQVYLMLLHTSHHCSRPSALTPTKGRYSCQHDACSRCAAQFFKWADGLNNRSHMAPLTPPPHDTGEAPTTPITQLNQEARLENRPTPLSPPMLHHGTSTECTPPRASVQAHRQAWMRAPSSATAASHAAAPNLTSLAAPSQKASQQAGCGFLNTASARMPGSAPPTCRQPPRLCNGIGSPLPATRGAPVMVSVTHRTNTIRSRVHSAV